MPFVQQGLMPQYVRSSQQVPPPTVEDESTDDEGLDEIPYRAPPANMSRPGFHQHPASSKEEPTDSQRADDQVLADARRANDALEARDDTYDPNSHSNKRRSDMDISPPASKSSKVNPSPPKPYDDCCTEVKAKRIELTHKIAEIWGQDHASWPTRDFEPARASVALEDPKEWGKPILFKLLELARVANDKASARTALSNAISARRNPTGERIWMTPNHISTAMSSLLSKERVREQPGPAAAHEDIEATTHTPTTTKAQNLNALPTDAAPPTPQASAKAKQDNRIRQLLDLIDHMDTQTVRNIAGHMLDEADIRDKREEDDRRRRAALTHACSGSF